MTTEPEAIAQQQELLATHRRTLAHLLQQAALYGGVSFAPPQTANGITEARVQIQGIKQALRVAGVAVENDPNDKAPAPSKPTTDLAEPISTLPPLRSRIVGRDTEIAEILRGLEARSGPIVVEGMPGMGKSALVNMVAHECYKQRQFDIFLWWSARYQPRTLNDLLDYISRELGRKSDAGQQYYVGPAEVRALLAGRKCLLIVTKVMPDLHREIIDFLYSLSNDVSVILTTTASIHESIKLDPFDQVAALAFLHARAQQLETSLAQFNDTQLQAICDAACGSPVALSLAVSLIKTLGPYPQTILQKLTSSGSTIDQMFSDIYRHLSERAQQALDLICISQDTISSAALMDILKLDVTGLQDEALAPLRRLGLLLEQTAERIEDGRFAPANRMQRDYYAAALHRRPKDHRRLRNATASYYARHCERYGHENWAGYDWIEQNLPEIWNALRWYQQKPAQFVKLFKAIYYFLGVRGYWRQRLEYGQQAVDAAEILNDRQSAAELLTRVIGWTKLQIGDYTAAERDIRRGADIFTALGDKAGLASAYRYLGTIERRRKNYEKARQLYIQALDYARTAPQPTQHVASIQVSLGTLALKLGRLDECEEHLNLARSAFASVRQTHASHLAEVISRLADVRFLQARLDEAEELYKASEKHAEPLKRQKTRAYNLLGLARIAQVRGNRLQAVAYATQAKELFGSLGITNETEEIEALRALLLTDGAA